MAFLPWTTMYHALTLFNYHQPKHCTCFKHVKFVTTLDDTSSLRKHLDSTEANLNLSLNGAIIQQVIKKPQASRYSYRARSWLWRSIRCLCKSLSKKIGLLKHISPYLKRSHKELYFDPVLKPSFRYGLSVWPSMSKVNLDSILRVQNRAARVTINAPFNARSVDLFNQRAKKVVSDSPY